VRDAAVVSRISGHEDAVRDGVTGLLVDGADELVGAMDAVLRDDVLRKTARVAAMEHAARFTWDTTARGTLAALGARPSPGRRTSGSRTPGAAWAEPLHV